MNSTRSPWAQFDIGLVTIEFTTPFLIGAGESDHLHDDVFQVDANGLPCIPGATLAGILRHAFADGGDPATAEACRRLFGYQDSDDGEASALRVSFGLIHDASDRPVTARGTAIDEVLSFFKAGVTRDHARIGMHGVVDGRGKFDELVVPAGARFTFELAVSHSSAQRIKDVLAVLARSELRIGRRSRSGLGSFQVVRARVATFDMREAADIKRLAKLPVDLRAMAAHEGLAALSVPNPLAGSAWGHYELQLQPVGTWVIGGGVTTGREPSAGRDRPWGRLPLTERYVRWEEGKNGSRGKVVTPQDAPFVVPGSSVKGALRHRTAFHARRLAGQWLEQGAESPGPTVEELVLYGDIKNEDGGSPGRVFISDAFVDAKTAYVPQQHVSLDRFTQGPMDHLLFDELAVGSCSISLKLSIQRDDRFDSTTLEALKAALIDLCQGRLALGAGRGHGRFKGTLKWLSGADLLEAKA